MDAIPVSSLTRWPRPSRLLPEWREPFVSPSAETRVLGLDVPRAIAVLMVLASHWSGHFGHWFNMTVPIAMEMVGNTGVDLFFALSGFLAGRILIKLAAEHRPSWRDYRVFLIRRAMRTLPLYFLWLGLLLLFFPPRHDALAIALRFATLTQNLITPMPPDYYFAVTWSLTVEAWFYLLFGAVFIQMARLLSSSRAMTSCLLIFMLGALSLRFYFGGAREIVVFRIDEIAYGVLIARLYMDGSRLFRHPWLALVCGLGIMAAPAPDWITQLVHPAQMAAGWGLCLPAAMRWTRAPHWFERKVRWLAARSYALYIIHLTIVADIVEVRIWTPALLPATFCVILAVLSPFLLAEAFYWLLEMPLMRRRPHQAAG